MSFHGPLGLLDSSHWAQTFWPFTLLKSRRKSEERRALFDANMFKRVKFDLWCMSWFFADMGLYILVFSIQKYGTSVVGLPASTTFWTLTTINAATMIGRIVPGFVADAVKDAVLVIAICTAGTTVLAFCWIADWSPVAVLFVFCALYGLGSGSFVSLSTPATVQLAPSRKGIGTRLEIFNGMGSIGLLIGSPSAGAIMAKTWVGMQVFCVLACVASILLLGSIMSYSRIAARSSHNR